MRKLLITSLLLAGPAFGAAPSLLPAVEITDLIPQHTCRYLQEPEPRRIACNVFTISELMANLALAEPKLWKPFRIRPGTCEPRFGGAVVHPRDVGGVLKLLRHNGWRVERVGYPATVLVQCS